MHEDYGSLLLTLADMPNNPGHAPVAGQRQRHRHRPLGAARIKLRRVVWDSDDAGGQSACTLEYALANAAAPTAPLNA
jgi:phage baseplate assembly protein W